MDVSPSLLLPYSPPQSTNRFPVQNAAVANAAMTASATAAAMNMNVHHHPHQQAPPPPPSNDGGALNHIIGDVEKGENYQQISLIGSGAYGTVYKARDLANDGHFVALKRVVIPLKEDGVPVNLIREVSLLKSVGSHQHPNVVKLLDICHGRRSEQESVLVLYLVFEHIEQDLASYLDHCPPPGLGPDRIRDISYQLVSGLDFLHLNRVVHRDLKPQNVLITSGGEVKIADFGLARLYDATQSLTTVVVTLWYRSPEVLLKSSYDSSVDIWSVGCIFAELFRRRPLFMGQSEQDQMTKIMEILGAPSQADWYALGGGSRGLEWEAFSRFRGQPFNQLIPEMCPESLDLLSKMLVFNGDNRITARRALEHEYFADMHAQYPPAGSVGGFNDSSDSVQNGTGTHSL